MDNCETLPLELKHEGTRIQVTQFLHYCVESGFTEVVTIMKLCMLILDSFVYIVLSKPLKCGLF